MNQSRDEDSQEKPDEPTADTSADTSTDEPNDAAEVPRGDDGESGRGAADAEPKSEPEPEPESEPEAKAEPSPERTTERGSGRPAAPASGGGRRRGGGGWLALALLLALGAGGGAGYLGWRLYQLELRVAEIPAERAAERAAALEPYLRPDALQPLRARVESLESQGAALSDRLSKRVDQLAESLEAVRAITERHQIGWRLAEIRYLLSVAARRLMIAYDPASAEAALSAADDAVAELQDVRLIPLRKAIVEDLGAVRAVEPADIEGIALRLQSLLSLVEDLPRAPVESGQDAPDGGDGGWLQQLRDQLADFVVVQRRPGGPAPVVPTRGQGLRPADALTLALEDAHRAALARNQDAYQQALTRAADTVTAHFDQNAAVTVRFRQGLADLRQRTVETEVPDLTGTLELAQRLAIEIELARREAAVEAAATAADSAAED